MIFRRAGVVGCFGVVVETGSDHATVRVGRLRAIAHGRSRGGVLGSGAHNGCVRARGSTACAERILEMNTARLTSSAWGMSRHAPRTSSSRRTLARAAHTARVPRLRQRARVDRGQLLAVVVLGRAQVMMMHLHLERVRVCAEGPKKWPS